MQVSSCVEVSRASLRVSLALELNATLREEEAEEARASSSVLDWAARLGPRIEVARGSVSVFCVTTFYRI